MVAGNHVSGLTALVLRIARLQTLPRRVSAHALPALLIIKDALLEITITGNHAWTSITRVFQDAHSVPRPYHSPLVFNAHLSTLVASMTKTINLQTALTNTTTSV
jgi:hypothetical protein